MAYSRDSGRIEDVFQDEIIKTIVNITDFKLFARSSNGLCLDQCDVRQIVEDNRNSVVDQKLGMLYKWKELQGEKATASLIRSLIRKYSTGNSEENVVILGDGKYEMYKNKPVCEGCNTIFYGAQLGGISGPHFCVIKLLEYNQKNLTETKILEKLRNHENVVSILQTGIYHGNPHEYIYIVMELSWKKHLCNVFEESIQNQTTLNKHTSLLMAIQIAKALVFIHNENVLHRDLKPANILVSEDGRHLKVTDFGISKTLSDGSSTNQTSANIGTDGYRAPETYDKTNHICRKCDIYSTGITLAQIFSNGKHPYGDEQLLWSWKIKNHKEPDLSHLCINEIKIPLENLIRRMLHSDPQHRPNAEEVLSILEKLYKNLIQDFTTERHNDAANTYGETELRHPVADLVCSQQLVQQIAITPPPSLKAQPIESEEVTKANALIMFDRQSRHMISFKPLTREWKTMQTFHDDEFTTVLLKTNLYSLTRKESYKLEYSDPNANWIQVAEMKEDHGRIPPATTFNGSIFVCGGSYPSDVRSTERFDEIQNQWNYATDILNIRRREPCIFATSRGLIYSIGGWGEGRNLLSTAEIFDGTNWNTTAQAPREMIRVSATKLADKLYIAAEDGVLCYNIQQDSWFEIMLSDQWPFKKDVRIFTVDDQLYLIGKCDRDRSQIFLLNPETPSMVFIEEIRFSLIHDATIAVPL